MKILVILMPWQLLMIGIQTKLNYTMKLTTILLLLIPIFGFTQSKKEVPLQVLTKLDSIELKDWQKEQLQLIQNKVQELQQAHAIYIEAIISTKYDPKKLKYKISNGKIILELN